MDDPDMGYWTYTYDENGNLATQTDAKNQVITFTYELLNRVYQKTYTPSANNPTVTYTYDNAINGKGQLYRVTNSNVTTTFNEYDEMGRVISVTKAITGDQPRTTETDYDLSGKVINITHPDGFEVRNTYYPGTNLLDTVKGTFDDVTIKEYAKCTEYEPTGKIGRITHTYNDTETVYTYDLQTTRLMDLLNTGQSGDIQHKSYDYTDAGDLLTITDYNGPTPVTYTYEYDNLHRLLSEDVTGDYLPPTGSEALVFTYGDSEHINAVTSINYNGTNYSFTYDANGNMRSGYDFTNPASIATRTLTWNADNMPLTVSRNGTVTTTLTYDGNGARAKKVAGGITTFYVSSNYEIKNGVATKYVFAGNMRVASVEGTNINSSKIFHKDHLGSSTAVTDNTGADIETTEYMPFGVQRSHSGANTSDYKYTDQELDNESGLYNYDARLYDPVIGRFISADSITPKPYNPQSLNHYSYCNNNPLIYFDPTGHYGEPTENWLYTAEHGRLAHNKVFSYMDSRFQAKSLDDLFLSNKHSMDFDRPLNQIWTGMSRNKPDIIDHTTKEIIELKPVTHIYSIPLRELDDVQLGGYINETSIEGYKEGDASNILPESMLKGGFQLPEPICDKNGDLYNVTLFSNADRTGFLYYRLDWAGTKDSVMEAMKNELKKALERGPNPNAAGMPIILPNGQIIPPMP